jgi:hypothetical protein
MATSSPTIEENAAVLPAPHHLAKYAIKHVCRECYDAYKCNIYHNENPCYSYEMYKHGKFDCDCMPLSVCCCMCDGGCRTCMFTANVVCHTTTVTVMGLIIVILGAFSCLLSPIRRYKDCGKSIMKREKKKNN